MEPHTFIIEIQVSQKSSPLNTGSARRLFPTLARSLILSLLPFLPSLPLSQPPIEKLQHFLPLFVTHQVFVRAGHGDRKVKKAWRVPVPIDQTARKFAQKTYILYMETPPNLGRSLLGIKLTLRDKYIVI